MGTKTNPDKFDCYKKAAPDEPLFILRGKDPVAPFLVEIWYATRLGNFTKAMKVLLAAQENTAVRNLIALDSYDKLDNAMKLAVDMRQYRADLDADSNNEASSVKTV